MVSVKNDPYGNHRWWYGLHVELLVMDLDDQLSLGPLFLTDRKCRTCGEEKTLIDGFYKKGSWYDSIMLLL